MTKLTTISACNIDAELHSVSFQQTSDFNVRCARGARARVRVRMRMRRLRARMCVCVCVRVLCVCDMIQI